MHALVPADIAAWIPASELVTLALQAAETVEGLPATVTGEGGTPERFSGPMLLTLIILSYARGILGAPEIARWAIADLDGRYLCGGRVPEASLIIHFRRRHRAQVLESLARLLGLAWLKHGAVDRRGWFAEAPFLDFPAEAGRRVALAVRLDSMLLDD